MLSVCVYIQLYMLIYICMDVAYVSVCVYYYVGLHVLENVFMYE